MLNNATLNMAMFYKQNFVNYIGTTSDTGEIYSEVICEWLLNNLSLLKTIPTITRNTTYKTTSHDGVPPKGESNRNEELIAMAIFRQKYLPILGEVIDYQTPLKNKQTDQAGKIDLLCYNDGILRVLELKTPNSTETMLRCVLEGYTYLRTVDHAKLLADFNLPKDTVVLTSPLVYWDSFQMNDYNTNHPHLINLMNILNVKPFYLENNEGEFDVRI